MEKFEQKTEETRINSEQIEDIALRACEMDEFQEAVKQSKNKIEAIKIVRELLSEKFPEIKEIPEPEKEVGFLPAASNEFMIAKDIVDLLYKKQSNDKAK